MIRLSMAAVLAAAGLMWAVAAAADAPAQPAKVPPAGTGVYLPPGQAPIYLSPGQRPSDYRNLALNPWASAETDVVSYFPHASSNSEFNKREFAARCAIDGSRKNNDVHGCGSWGPDKKPDVWWKLDFGRPVEIDKLVIFLRAAWDDKGGGHDSYWKEAVVEFSDGTSEKLQFKQDAAGQEFKIASRTVTWLKLKELRAAEPKWVALCELEAYGKDAREFKILPTDAK